MRVKMYRQYIVNIIIINKFFSFRHRESDKLFILVGLKNNSNRNHNNIFSIVKKRQTSLFA